MLSLSLAVPAVPGEVLEPSGIRSWRWVPGLALMRRNAPVLLCSIAPAGWMAPAIGEVD